MKIQKHNSQIQVNSKVLTDKLKKNIDSGKNHDTLMS